MARRSAENNDGLVIVYKAFGNRSVPIVFILVSSLIIANISCDQVGSATAIGNFESSLASSAATAVTTSSAGESGPSAKYDPLNMLREIYLDHDSKVITLLSSPTGNSVQKFHPNGRYGRRSVDNFADAPGAHMELAKLSHTLGFGEDGGNSRSLLQMDNNPAAETTAAWNELPDGTASNSKQQQQNKLRWLLANKKSNPRHGSQPQTTKKPNADGAGAAFAPAIGDYRQELNKLLKCNYSGVPNLFWCDS